MTRQFRVAYRFRAWLPNDKKPRQMRTFYQWPALMQQVTYWQSRGAEIAIDVSEPAFVWRPLNPDPEGGPLQGPAPEFESAEVPIRPLATYSKPPILHSDHPNRNPLMPSPITITILDPVDRIARLISRHVCQSRTSQTHSDIRRDINHRDRQYLDDSIEFAIEKQWLRREVVVDGSTGRVRARYYRPGVVVAPVWRPGRW